MSELEPTGQNRIAHYKEAWQNWPPVRKGIAIAGAGIALSSAITLGIANANGEESPGEVPSPEPSSDYYTSAAETETDYETGYPTGSPADPESPTEAVNETFWESQGDYCRSEISTLLNKVTLKIYPSNEDLGSMMIQHAGLDIKYGDTIIYGPEVHITDNSNFDIYAIGDDVVAGEFDTSDGEYCGSFKIIDYDERGLPIFEDVAPEVDAEPSQTPEAEPTTSAPAPEDPFAFEGVQDDGGDWRNCEVNDETGEVRIYHNGGELPDGLKLAFFVYNSKDTSVGSMPEIHFPNSQGKVILKEESTYYSGHMAVIVPEDTPSGPNDSYPSLDYVYINSLMSQAGVEDHWQDAVSDDYSVLDPSAMYPYAEFDENHVPAWYCG